ncbi:MAG: hypothetical protein EA352_03935 [Gemmatimonadales bacterium]|nr:MAG: hypothetical protein EA352_03935 [Gemmatimonadales bacterium]
MDTSNLPPLELAETGTRDRKLDRRLFMQLQAFGGCDDPTSLARALETRQMPAVLYEDFHDPFGVAVLGMSDDPDFLAGPWREMLRSEPFRSLVPKPMYTMVGRTYSLGYEPDLEDTLLHRPRRTATNPDWPWAIWYPLRRSGQFSRLPLEEQKQHLKEHGRIGFRYGRADAAHDIRLASHGMDTHDNDFTVAVVGPELSPLSKLVEEMRGTVQTSLYLERLGPFFVGRTVWQAPADVRPPASGA